MGNHVILGVNQESLNHLKPGSILIDTYSTNEYLDFSYEQAQFLYQASLLAGQMDVSDFEATTQFYQQVLAQQKELQEQNKRELIQSLKGDGHQVINGRIIELNDHNLTLNFLGENQTINFDSLVDVRKSSEDNMYQNPFIYTFREFVESQGLFKTMAVEARTLRGLEIASLYSRFGVEVSVICDRKLLGQIGHLMFRDGLRQSLINSGVKLFEKYEIDEIETKEQSLLLSLNPITNLAFEIGDQLTPQTLEVEVLIIENQETATSSQVLFVEPMMMQWGRQQDTRTIRFNCHELSYFRTRFELDGGIELNINENKLVGATLMCANANHIGELMKVLSNKSIDEILNVKCTPYSMMALIQECLSKAKKELK